MGNRKASTIQASDIVKALELLVIEELLSYGLSRRQCQVAYRLFYGYSGNLIAKKLYLTPSCIRYHISIIYTKTKSRCREDFLRTIWHGVHVSKTKWNGTKAINEAIRLKFEGSGEWINKNIK